MFCDQCGQRVDPAATICHRCGALLDSFGGATQQTIPAPRDPSSGLIPVGRTHQPTRRLGVPPPAAFLSFLGMHLRGTLAAIVGAWFNVPFVLLMTAAGAIIGGIAGAVSGTFAGPAMLDRLDTLLRWGFPLPVSPRDLLPTAAIQIGGVIGGLLGAVSGAVKLGWMAGIWPWQALYDGDALWPFELGIGRVVTALVLGAIAVAVYIVADRLLLHLAGARRLSRREDEWLSALLDSVAADMGVATPPALLMTEERIPRAYASTRYLVLSRGLIEELELDRKAIAGVLAHELAHWRNGDAIAVAWIKGVALPLYVLHELAYRLVRGVRYRPLQWLLRSILWSVLVTVSYLVRPCQSAGLRRAEYAADAAAMAAGHGDGLRRALSRLQFWEGGRDGWDEVMAASHPYTELRLERLEKPGRRYPSHDDNALVAPRFSRDAVTSHMGEP